jgi:hypothetical protein
MNCRTCLTNEAHEYATELCQEACDEYASLVRELDAQKTRIERITIGAIVTNVISFILGGAVVAILSLIL